MEIDENCPDLAPNKRISPFAWWSRVGMAVVIAGLSLLPGRGSAQYRVFDWVNFNDGRLPTNLSLGHDASPEVVQPFSLTSGPLSSALLDPVSRSECAPYALSFTPTEKRFHLSVLSPLALDRNLLGNSGRALFQSDFYLPAEGEVAPSMSLLAAFDEKGERKAYRWYRFGFMPDKNLVFFAFVNATDKPELFHTQKMSTLNLARPGWHRFQIVFEGSDRIICAINGTPTAFPAINEPTLRMLNAGVLVTRPTMEPGQESLMKPAVMDNLSIQYTPGAAEFPDSPWTRKADVASATGHADASLLDPASGLKWHENTADALAESKSTQRPLLIMWYTPRSAPHRYFENLMPKDEATRHLLEKYVLLRVDVNQLNGGFQAQKYNIVRVPTLMVMNPGGAELRRLPVIANQTKLDAVLDVLKGG